MEEQVRRLAATPLLRTNAVKFEEIAYLSTQYRDIERMPAWQDHINRLVEMKKMIEGEVLRGTLDKFGKDRSDEKRAVHHFLTTILGYVPAIHQDFEKRQKQLEKRVEDRTTQMGRKIDEHITNWR
jgi:hypothetical protein